MGISRLFGQTVLVFIVFVGCTFVSFPSHAFDLTGAWTTQPDTGQTQQSVCDKVFVKKSGSISFRQDSELMAADLLSKETESEGRQRVAR